MNMVIKVKVILRSRSFQNQIVKCLISILKLDEMNSCISFFIIYKETKRRSAPKCHCSNNDICLSSYTFERVQENSEKVWRFFRYDLIFEYFDRPALAAPLIIITHVFRIFAYFCGKATGSNFDTDFGKLDLI